MPSEVQFEIIYTFLEVKHFLNMEQDAVLLFNLYLNRALHRIHTSSNTVTEMVDSAFTFSSHSTRFSLASLMQHCTPCMCIILSFIIALA